MKGILLPALAPAPAATGWATTQAVAGEKGGFPGLIPATLQASPTTL
jgi:hypothetical protein